MSLRTRITRQKLYAVVELLEQGKVVCITTMERDVQTGDARIKKLKRRHLHAHGGSGEQRQEG